MVQFAPINFGLIIAYFLPGTVMVYALRYISPRVNLLWSSIELGQVVAGPLILIGVLALVLGLVVSAFRVVVLEEVFYCTGVERKKIHYEKIATVERRGLFEQMVENVYRYEQFYGNVMLSLLVFLLLRYLSRDYHILNSRSEVAFILGITASLVVLFVATRHQLSEVSRAIGDLSK